MKWALLLLLAGCSSTPAGVFCEGIGPDTKLSALPTRALLPASHRESFWAFQALYLFDTLGLDAACRVGNCEEASKDLRFSVLDKPFSSDCGNGGFGMCHVIVDSSDRIVAATYRCQD